MILFVLNFLVAGIQLMFVAPQALTSEAPECNIIYNGIDLETKKHRIEIAPAMLLQHTPPVVKSELQEGNLMYLRGQIVQIDDIPQLHLNIRINSQKALEYYGTVSAGYILKIILLDGKEVKLTCTAGSGGIANDNRGFIYPLGYELDKRDLKTLSKQEVDKIGIQWSTGYEEYPIYEIDFFINQIACLERATNSN